VAGLGSPTRVMRPPQDNATPFALRTSSVKVAVESVSSAGLDLAPLVGHRQPDHLPGRRRFVLLGRAQAQMVEDAPDGQLVGNVGHDLERTSAASTDERVGVVHLADEPYAEFGISLILPIGLTPQAPTASVWGRAPGVSSVAARV
jgi:hypothetical protein